MSLLALFLRGLFQAGSLTIWFILINWIGLLEWKMDWTEWAILVAVTTPLFMVAIPLDARWRASREKKKLARGLNAQ